MTLFNDALSELQYFLNNISSPFSGYSGPQGQPLGERGFDVGLPYHTPIYATAPGTILGVKAQYGGGGVISEQVAPTLSEYYQHLSDEVVTATQKVTAGQLIGYSGGQLGYGNNPSSPAFSSGPHIEIGFNGPWGAPWDSLGANFNPVSDLSAQAQALSSGSTVVNYPVSGSGSGGIVGAEGTGSSCGPVPDPTKYPHGVVDPQYIADTAKWQACMALQGAQNTAGAITDPVGTALNDIGTWFNQTFGITSGADFAWRILFIGLAIILFLFGLAVVVLDLLDKSNVEIAGSRV